MHRHLWTLALLLSCCLALSQSLGDEELDETLRALDNMYRLQRYLNQDEQQEERNVQEQEEEQEEEERDLKEKFKCRKEGEACRSIPSCCGEQVCYWENGFSLLKDGKCVQCIEDKQTCQRDSQCCSNLQCNKKKRLYVDGTCGVYRRSGPCYRDGQCVTECVKKWYELSGHCT